MILSETPQEAQRRRAIEADCERKSQECGRYIDQFTTIWPGREVFLGCGDVWCSRKNHCMRSCYNLAYRRQGPFFVNSFDCKANNYSEYVHYEHSKDKLAADI